MTLVATREAEIGHAAEHEWLDGICPQRVLVVDEHELLMAGLRAVLSEAPWVEHCLTASSAAAGLQVARRYYPQLVLVSVSLGGRSGPDLCRALRERMPHVKIVLMFGDGRMPAAVASALGAVAALSKRMTPGAILMAIKHVAEGGRVFPRGRVTPAVNLSGRELDVLHHLAEGLSNPETAASLKLSRHTVKQHTSSVYRKLGVRNRAEAASRAQELGLLGRFSAADSVRTSKTPEPPAVAGSARVREPVAVTGPSYASSPPPSRTTMKLITAHDMDHWQPSATTA